MASFGCLYSSALLGSGLRGRGFESHHLDQLYYYEALFLGNVLFLCKIISSNNDLLT